MALATLPDAVAPPGAIEVGPGLRSWVMYRPD